jgi:hypothetical protein
VRLTPRRAALASAALAGIVVGVVASMALTDPGAPRLASGAEEIHVLTTTTTATTTVPPPEKGPAVLLVWTSGGLPPGFADEVRAIEGVEGVTLVRGDETGMTASAAVDGQPVDVTVPGWHIPLDTLAVDPVSFAAFLSGDAAEAVLALRSGQALLTETSARLRRLGRGATIQIADAQLAVAGIIDDLSGAGAEVLVTADDADTIGVTTERYLLVHHSGDREQLQRAIADRLHGRAVRFRSTAETTWLRHGDAVEPAAKLKAAFGEFAIRDRTGRDVEIDPAWIAREIVTESVPILGDVTCNRRVIESLRAAMTELEEANLAHLVDAHDFAGCFAARRTEAGQPLSHHAWGAALDLNVDGNPRGSFSTQDPRLVETMARHGFTWGGTWLVPDPAHYEAPVPEG